MTSSRVAVSTPAREVRGDDDGRDIAVPERGAVYVKAQMREHRLDGLLGEGRIAQGVAGPLQTNDKAVADELTVARTCAGPRYP